MWRQDGAGPLPAALLRDLERALGPRGVSVDPEDRRAHARDSWLRERLFERAGGVERLPAAVVWPRRPESVGAVLELARRAGVPVVPFGRGTGTEGAARAVSGGITLCTGRLQQVGPPNPESGEIEVQAGVGLAELERHLARFGLGLGLRTVDAGAGTLGGRYASGYTSDGREEGLESVLRQVELYGSDAQPHVLVRGDRPGGGADWIRCLAGAEGTAGVVVGARVAVRPRAEARRLRLFRFRGFERGIDGARALAQSSLRPTVARLFSELEGLLPPRPPSPAAWEALGPSRAVEAVARSVLRRAERTARSARGLVSAALDGAAEASWLLVGFEGAPEVCRMEIEAATELLVRLGAENLGPRLAEQWWRARVPAAFARSRAALVGRIRDQIDLSASWDRVPPLLRHMREAVGGQGRLGVELVRIQPSGAGLELVLETSVSELRGRAALERHEQLWRALLQAVHEGGGALSQRSGVGLARAGGVARSIGAGGARVQGALRSAADPEGLLNPDKQGGARFGPVRRPQSQDLPSSSWPEGLASAVGEANLLERAGRPVARAPDARALLALTRVAFAHGWSLHTEQHGGRPAEDALEVDLGLLDGVPRISEHACLVTCEAGVGLDRLEPMLARHGVTLGRLHPGAWGCTVGEALAHGYLVSRAGPRAERCLALEAALPHGEAVSTRIAPRNVAGPSVMHGFIGARGRYGIITAATLRIQRRPQALVGLAFGFEALSGAIGFARGLMDGGLEPRAVRVRMLESGVVAAVEIEGDDAEHLEVRRRWVMQLATGQGGGLRRADAEDIEARGRGQAVEIELPWSSVADAAEALGGMTYGEIAIDLVRAWGATVFVPARDPAARVAAAEWGLEHGGRVAAPSELACSSGRRFGDRVAAQLAPDVLSLSAGVGTGYPAAHGARSETAGR